MPLILSGSSGLSGNVGNVTKDMMPAGSVLQSVSVTKTDTWTSSSSSWVDVSGLVASITPLNATSKILAVASVAIGINYGYFVMARIARNGSAIAQGDAAGSRLQTAGMVYMYNQNAGGGNSQITWPCQVLDSPNSLTAQTYSVQMRQLDGAAMYVNRLMRDDNASYEPRSISTLTLMEIKA